MRTYLAGILVVLVTTAIAACGGGNEETTAAEEPTPSAPCGSIEEVDIGPVQHSDQEFTAADYATNPPAGGDHNDPALQAGTFYTDPPPLGEAVHFLEHGAVIGWTHDLSDEDRQAVEDAFDEVFKEGYYQLAVVENPELDVSFAVSAWGALQKCDEVDTSVIRPFVEEWYASPKSGESSLACDGQARRLASC